MHRVGGNNAWYGACGDTRLRDQDGRSTALEEEALHMVDESLEDDDE